MGNLQRLIYCFAELYNEERGHVAAVVGQSLQGGGQEDTQCGGEVLLRMTCSGREGKQGGAKLGQAQVQLELAL